MFYMYNEDLPRLNGLASPWAMKRLDEFGGDISRFRVAKMSPSRLRQMGIEGAVATAQHE